MLPPFSNAASLPSRRNSGVFVLLHTPSLPRSGSFGLSSHSCQLGVLETRSTTDSMCRSDSLAAPADISLRFPGRRPRMCREGRDALSDDPPHLPPCSREARNFGEHRTDGECRPHQRHPHDRSPKPKATTEIRMALVRTESRSNARCRIGVWWRRRRGRNGEARNGNILTKSVL